VPSERMRRPAFVLSTLTSFWFVVVGCSSSPATSPTAVRLIAGTYHYEIRPASCPDFNSKFTGGHDLGPVQLSQSGSTVTIDSVQQPFGTPSSATLQMSGTISGAMLSFQFSGHWSPRSFVGSGAEGHGIAMIDAQSISGRFSGTTSYLDIALNFPYGAMVPCTSDDHSIVLTRVS
jgi:hypothetical protein